MYSGIDLSLHADGESLARHAEQEEDEQESNALDDRDDGETEPEARLTAEIVDRLRDLESHKVISVRCAHIVSRAKK